MKTYIFIIVKIGKEIVMANRLIYGMDLETWNALSEEEQIAIANREEYRSQHMDQIEWFLD